MIHSTSDVQSENIGSDTKVWQYSVILEKAIIGKNCNINCHVFIENDVVIGDNVTVKSGVQIWDGIEIEDHVFVGPNVTFTNDKHPRSKNYPTSFQKTVIREYASLGAGSIILGGVTIGSYSLIGAGSLVTKDVPERALVVGSPAVIKGWLNDDGSKMEKAGERLWIDKDGEYWTQRNNRITKK